eukprot:TRINITY_DN795_c0_g1_i1.p1 TRINITY_DN795_c0_g1~~TRINITY_DN795_c0_g1_i1.p1  ORF type:complete len:215 (+),score=40.96 TRINITY_DN795_c0_g1_i1:56-700(+)
MDKSNKRPRTEESESVSDSPIILSYYDGRARGEPTRLLFAEAGVKFEDNRLDKEGVAALKATGALPFDQTPILEIDGIKIAQSRAISRYVARKYGLYGKDEKQGAIADMVVDAINDFLDLWYKSFHDPASKDKFPTEVLPVWLGYFEKLLSDKEYFAGEFTYGDIWVYELLDNIVNRMYADALPKFPTLVAHKKRIEERPKIAAYLAQRKPTPY